MSYKSAIPPLSLFPKRWCEFVEIKTSGFKVWPGSLPPAKPSAEFMADEEACWKRVIARERARKAAAVIQTYRGPQP